MALSKLALTAAGTAADVQAAQTAVQPENTPIAPGFNAVAFIVCKGVTGTPVIKIQGSDDNTNWTDLLTYDALTSDQVSAEVTVYPYMRSNVTTAGSAGDFEAYLLG